MWQVCGLAAAACCGMVATCEVFVCKLVLLLLVAATLRLLVAATLRLLVVATLQLLVAATLQVIVCCNLAACAFFRMQISLICYKCNLNLYHILPFCNLPIYLYPQLCTVTLFPLPRSHRGRTGAVVRASDFEQRGSWFELWPVRHLLWP